MRLLACYTLYNGLELLKGSIEQIYDHVDCILLLYQDVSNWGQHREGIEEYLQTLEGDKIIIAKWTPDMKFDTKTNEKNKHNYGLHIAKKMNMTHFLLMASDHYFIPEEFATAKEQAKEYNATYCKMYTYWKEPTYQLYPVEAYHAPFIYAINNNTEFGGDRPVYLDPSCYIKPVGNWKVLDVMMHHYSYVRKDIGDKLNNAAAKVNWKASVKEKIQKIKDWKLGDEMIMFTDYEIKEVPNYFAIDLQSL